ncbi:hypothetical protein P3T43_003150 [Paraburkholderia sp. GAS41]|jgi:hypothetical protein|uniref:hypothetical protein n=1 Tax=Paraburkholderia sp. GAS41 TaxID=3035134 RepID=UPI003D1DD095
MHLFIIIALAITIGPLLVGLGLYIIAAIVGVIFLPFRAASGVSRAKICNGPLSKLYSKRWGVFVVVPVMVGVLWVLQYLG